MKLELKKFDMSRIKDDKVIVAIGKRGCGKSQIIKDIMYRHKDIPVGTVISATESANQFFGDFVPKIFIHDEYKPEIINNSVRRQKMVLKKINAEEQNKYGSMQNKIDPRSFVILDDCLYDSSWTKDSNIRALFMNGRHLKVMFCITMQYPLGIGPSLRTNIDFVFICRENIVSNRKRLYDNYAGMFPTFEIFCTVMDQCTNNYECLVIDNTSQSNKLEDTVFWYKAEQHSNFKVCQNYYWDISKNLPDGDEEEDFDASKFKSKNRPNIRVKKK